MAQKNEQANASKSRREKGTGTIWQKDNGTWMGRVDIGRGSDGKRKFKNFSGKTETEVKRKIREYNKTGDNIETNKISVGSYVQNWLRTYKMGTIKLSSYDALEKTIKNYIIPNIGMIQLQQLTSDDVQALLNKLKNEDGYSYSTVKKVHDCLNAVLLYATIKKDITDNPMLLINALIF